MNLYLLSFMFLVVLISQMRNTEAKSVGLAINDQESDQERSISVLRNLILKPRVIITPRRTRTTRRTTHKRRTTTDRQTLFHDKFTTPKYKGGVEFDY